MRSQKTSSDRPKKNASATAVRNARKCAGQSGQKSKIQNKKQKDGKQTKNKSACKIDKKCGGCQFQKMPYKEQLKKKAEAGRTAVRRILQSQPDHWHGTSIFLQK